jgi:hypothetical protein
VIALVFLASLPMVMPERESHTILELVEAGNVEAAMAVLAHWTALDRVRMAHGVGFDYLMNPAYMNAVAIACVWAGRSLRTVRARMIASWLAWLCWSVVFTNAAENVGLFVALTSGPSEPWPPIVAGAHYWAGFVVAMAALFSVSALALRIYRATRR